MATRVKQAPEDRAQATRATIIQAAREMVVENGYADVSTAQILRRAGVSRGGLYHHFDGKQGLLLAVLEAVERDVAARLISDVAGMPDDPFARLVAGIQAYLDLCRDSVELQRIGLLEGRRAVGWEQWRRIVSAHGMRLIARGLQASMDAGQIERQDPEPLAYMILAVIHEAGTAIACAANRDAARAREGHAVATIIEGLGTR